MSRDEVILQTAQIKTSFNKDIMLQIKNLASNPKSQFFSKRDELLNLEIQLTNEEKEILK